jgi:hypothetical protein
MLKNLGAAVKALLIAWREPPPRDKEYEQYHEAKMRAESGVFEGEKEREMQEAPPSVVDLLANKEHDKAEWLQQPGQHSFNDEMGGDTLYTELLSKKEQK